jgi:hypothetical protein
LTLALLPDGGGDEPCGGADPGVGAFGGGEDEDWRGALRAPPLWQCQLGEARSAREKRSAVGDPDPANARFSLFIGTFGRIDVDPEAIDSVRYNSSLPAKLADVRISTGVQVHGVKSGPKKFASIKSVLRNLEGKSTTRRDKAPR